MGSGAPYYPKPSNHSIGLLNKAWKLLVITFKTYDVPGQFTDHIEIESLVETYKGYIIVRFSYAQNGLTVHQLETPRTTPCKSFVSYKVRQFRQQDAWNHLTVIAQIYNRKRYQLLSTNCKSFVEQVQNTIEWMCSKTYSTAWQYYNDL